MVVPVQARNEPTIGSPEWWRVPHLARHFSVGEATIRTAIRSGELPARQMGPKTIVVRLTDAQRWFDERSTPVVGRQEDLA